MYSLCLISEDRSFIRLIRYDTMLVSPAFNWRVAHRHNNRGDRGRLVPQLLGWETNNVLVPQLCSDIHVLGSPLMSAEATRTQDLASEFSKNFWECTPDLHSGRGRPLPALTLSPARGGWDPNLGPPQLFSRGCAPGVACTSLFEVFVILIMD